MNREPSAAGTRRLAWLAVPAILAVALGLRAHGLGSWPLDGDELYSHYDVADLLAGHVPDEGVRSYPLGYLLMAASAWLFGLSELGLRLAAAVSSVGAVVALALGRRDVVTRPVALAAALLAAISPWLVYHGQEARFYGPLLLFSTLATLAILPGPRRRPTAALAWAALATACHPSAALLLAGVLFAWLRGRLPLRAVVLLGLVGLAGASVWVAGSDASLARVLREAVLRRTLAGYDAAHYVAGLGYNLGPVAGALAAWGGLVAWRRRVAGHAELLACGLAPPALLLLPALAGVSVQQRYAMAAVPALLLLAGTGWAALRGRPWLAGGVAVAALAVPLPELANLWRTGDRADMRAAAAWLAERASPEDVLVADEHALLQLYLSRDPRFADAAYHEAPLDGVKMWGFPRNRREVWVVLKANRMGADYGADFTAWVERYFDPVTEIGPRPPPLARHDNRLLVFERRERVVDRPGDERPPPGAPR